MSKWKGRVTEVGFLHQRSSITKEHPLEKKGERNTSGRYAGKKKPGSPAERSRAEASDVKKISNKRKKGGQISRSRGQMGGFRRKREEEIVHKSLLHRGERENDKISEKSAEMKGRNGGGASVLYLRGD